MSTKLKKDLTGVGVALITTFDKNRAIDFKALKKVMDHVQNEIAYWVILGTTAETVTLTTEEQQEVLNFVLKNNSLKKPIVLGLGGNNTAEVLKKVETLNNSPLQKEISAILTVTPYYNKPSQEGLFKHYTEVASLSKVPVILYNVPGRTGVNMSSATTLRLANSSKNIIGIKEASGDLTQMGYIIKDRPKDFLVISGDDGTTLPAISFGCDGVISVAANVWAKEFCSMVNLALKGKFKEAAQIHLSLLEPINLLFKEGNPVGAKAFLKEAKICEDYVRLPLSEASQNLYNEIKKVKIAK